MKNSVEFYRKFTKYLLVGLSALVLLVGSQQMILGDSSHRGPNFVLADEDDCATNPDSLGCPNPAEVIGEEPLPPEQPAPAPTPAQQCTEVRQYNECIACNTSRRISQDSCGNYKVIVASQNDTACSSLCPAPPPAPPAPPVPPAQPTYGTLSITPAAACVDGPGQEQISVSWNNIGAASYQPDLRISGSSVAQACVGETSYNFGNFSIRTDANYIVFVHAYSGANCSGHITSASSILSNASCPIAPVPQPVVPPQPQPQPQACPAPGQPGTQQLCAGQWAFDECVVVERFSDGSPAKYSCVFSGNRNGCRGDISCPGPTQVSACTPGFLRQDTECIGSSLCTFNVHQRSDCSIERRGPFSCFRSSLCDSGRPGSQGPQGPAGPVGSAGAPGVPGAVGGSITNTNTNTITVNAQTTREVIRETFGNVGVGTTVYTTSPQVQGVTYLPKTGLPALAWTALAFIPTGFRMRRLGRVKTVESPMYLWEDRQFKVGS